MARKATFLRKIKHLLITAVAVLVVIAGVLSALPRVSAAATCANPQSAWGYLAAWLADSLDMLGEYGDTLTDFMEEDVQTGQDETEQRIKEFDENTREGLSEWWLEDYLPAMKEATKQLSTAMIDESRQRGSAIDGQESARRLRTVENAETEAYADLQPSEMACIGDTIAAGGGAPVDDSGGSCSFEGGTYQNGWSGLEFAENGSCTNSQSTRGDYQCCNGTMQRRILIRCGEPQQVYDCSGNVEAAGDPGDGIRAGVEAAQNIARGANEEAAKQATAAKGSPEAIGETAVIADKWATMLERYCDPASNSGDMPCTGSGMMADKNIEIGSSLLWGEDMTINLGDPRYAHLFLDAKRAFVDQEPATAIPIELLDQPQAIFQFNMIRSTAARKQSVHSVIGQMMADRVARAESDPLPAVQEIRVAAGIPREQTSAYPSVYEINQALFHERYMQPEFVTQVLRTPEELLKNNLDVQTGHLVQWNKMYKRMERLAVMFAAEFASDIEQITPDYGNDEPVGGGPVASDAVDIDPDDPQELPECDLIDFEIPDDPFDPDPGDIIECTGSSQLCEEGWGDLKSRVALCISQSDNAGVYSCAMGTANILLAMGYPVQRGNAEDWLDGRMEANGWQRISCHPTNCPPGAVIVYDNYDQYEGLCGEPGYGTGRACGHIEIVTDVDGQRRYVSDKPRANWGGSVGDQVGNGNYAVYIYPGTPSGYNALAQRCLDRIQNY